MNDEPDNDGRMTIYFDEERRIADAVGTAAAEYHPGNDAAVKLCLCAEAAKDICEILEAAWECEGETEKIHRRLKAVFTPLHSLAERTVDLINEIQSNPKDTNAGAAMVMARNSFLAAVPLGRREKLGQLRNKISAHHERGMSPSEMRDLFAEVEITEIGEWLHTILNTLLDLLRLPVYFWSVDSPDDKVINMMFCEPMIVSIGRDENGVVNAFYGMRMCRESPRWQFVDVFARTAGLALPLFERASEKQIVGILEPPRKAFFDPSVRFILSTESLPAENAQ